MAISKRIVRLLIVAGIVVGSVAGLWTATVELGCPAIRRHQLRAMAKGMPSQMRQQLNGWLDTDCEGPLQGLYDASYVRDDVYRMPWVKCETRICVPLFVEAKHGWMKECTYGGGCTTYYFWCFGILIRLNDTDEWYS